MDKVLKYQLNEAADLNLPSVIKDFISESTAQIIVYEYNYTGDITDHDFFNIGNYLNSILTHEDLTFYLISYSFYMPNSLLARKMKYDFGFTKYGLMDYSDIAIPVMKEKYIVKLGYTCINTINDWRNCVSFLFPRNYEKRSILLGADKDLEIISIAEKIKKSIAIVRDRYGAIQDVRMMIKPIWELTRNNNYIIYPYGGADFGSCYLFEITGNVPERN